jgi:hypothetical protein
MSKIVQGNSQQKVISKTRTTKGATFTVCNGNPAKAAGSNSLNITIKSEDWRLSDSTVRMTIRDAKVLRSLLNEVLDDSDNSQTQASE